MTQRSRSQTPPGRGDNERKPLKEMTPVEFIDWTASRSARLADFSEYVERWMQRRAGRGKHNYHDEQYEAFQGLAADLIAGLDELREEREQAAAHQKKEEQ